MADKDSKSTERAANQAQNMTERSPGSRDMGGKPAGTLQRQDRGEDGPAAIGGTAGNQATPTPRGQAAGLANQPVNDPTAPRSAVAPMPTSNDPELGRTEINTQPPHPGFTTGIGADPMQTRVGQTGPLQDKDQARKPPVWLRNEAGENYLAPGEGPKKGDTMELVGPGGERWSVEVARVHGEPGDPDHRADVLVKGVAMPGAAQSGARIEFPG